MTATYQSIGAKVDSIILRICDPYYIPLAASNSNSILLHFRAHANLTIKTQSLTEPDVHFCAPADIFIPAVLQQTSINADEVCGIIRSRLSDKYYALKLQSLTPLSDISNINAYKVLDGFDLSVLFARYFSPDSTVTPSFIYSPDPNVALFNDLKDVLRPMT